MTDPKTLDRLLDLRRHEEQKRAVELASAKEAVRDSEASLELLQERRSELEAELESLAGESVGQLKTLRLLIEQVDHGIHNARSIRAMAAATELEKAQEFTKAMQQREALERVVIPRREEARELDRRNEQKAADDLTALRYARGSE